MKLKSLYFISVLLLLQNTLISQTKPALSFFKSNGDLLWYYYTDYTHSTELVSNQAGKIYFVGYNTAGITTSTLYCLNEIGNLLWSVDIPERIETDPMIVPQTGEIIIVSQNSGELYCLNPDGSTNWIYDAGGQPAAIDTIGNIYFTQGPKLYSLTSGGTYNWEYTSSDGNITSPVSVTISGEIYFGTEFSKLIGVHNWGGEIFVADLFDYVRGEPTIDSDGTIYMATSSVDLNKSKIEAFSPDGSLFWDLTVNEPNPSAVIIGDSNYLYIRTINFWGGGFGRLYKIDKITQTIVWSYYFGGTGGSTSTPTVTDNGTCYFSTVGTTSGRFYAINSDGTVKWDFNPVANGLDCSPLGSILIGTDGNVFTFGMNMDYEGCCLIALEESNEQLAESPWPMLHHDNFRTGLAENIVVQSPNIYLPQQLIDFGYVEPGAQQNDTICIKNIGEEDLEIDWSLESDVFEVTEIITDNLSTEILLPGDSLLMVINFAPETVGMFTDTLFIYSNDPDQPVIDLIINGQSSHEGDIKWIVQLDNVESGPAIDDFQTIYVSGYDNVWAVKSDGQIKWVYDILSSSDSYDYQNITISNDNRFLFFPSGKIIISIDSSGVEQWDYDPPANDKVTTIAYSNSNKVYFADRATYNGGYLYCLDNSGIEIWNYYANKKFLNEPVIDMTGNLIFAGNLGNTGALYSINQGGSLNWQKPFYSSGLVTIGSDDIIYIGGMDGIVGGYYPCVKAYDKNGNELWSTDLLDEFHEVASQITIGINNELYFGVNDWYDDNGALYSLDNEGNILWVKNFDMPVFTAPAIASSGSIYFGCENGNFYALNPDGSERWIIETGNDITSSPAIDTSGIIYFTNENDQLFAVYGENGGLAKTPWPMKQHDTKHSSSVDSLTVNIENSYNRSSDVILYQNKPNPFNDKTVFTFYLPASTKIKCTIADIHGKQIYNWNTVKMESGIHQLIWEKQNIEGVIVNPGIYIFTLKATNEYLSRKIVVY